jgi:hypothetical protein
VPTNAYGDGIISRMAEPGRDEALERLRAAAAKVREHDAQREELAAAIVFALTHDVRPVEVDEIVPWDRNYVRRVAKKAGVPARRESTVRPRHDDTPRSSA